MTINLIWWCGSRSVAQESVEYPFIAISPAEVVSRRVRLISQIDLFANYSYQIGIADIIKACVKSVLRN